MRHYATRSLELLASGISFDFSNRADSNFSQHRIASASAIDSNE